MSSYTSIFSTDSTSSPRLVLNVSLSEYEDMGPSWSRPSTHLASGISRVIRTLPDYSHGRREDKNKEDRTSDRLIGESDGYDTNMESEPWMITENDDSHGVKTNDDGYQIVVDVDEKNKDKLEIAERDETKTRILLILFLIMLIIGTINRVFSKLLTIPMHNYPLTVNITICLIYCLFYSCYVFPTLYFGSGISDEEQLIPKYKFAIMGGLDSISSIMQGFAFNYIASGSLLILLMQSAIPVSMIITKIWLQTKYKWYHYGGAAVVLTGLVIALIPSLTNVDNDNQVQLIWSAVLVASCIPQGISAVYKEKIIAEHNMNGLYLNACISVFQLLFTLVLAAPSAYTQPHLTAAQMPQNVWNGFKCMVGQNSVTVPSQSLVPVDDCNLSPFYFGTYIAFNLIYNIIIVFMLKFGSSNILYLALTAIVPLVDCAFSLNFVPGSEPFTSYSIVGLIVILLGIGIYRFTSYLKRYLYPKYSAEGTKK